MPRYTRNYGMHPVPKPSNGRSTAGTNGEAAALGPRNDIDNDFLEQLVAFNNQVSRDQNSNLPTAPTRWDASNIDPRLLQGEPSTAINSRYENDQNHWVPHNTYAANDAEPNPAQAMHDSGVQDSWGFDTVAADVNEIYADAAQAAAEPASYAGQQRPVRKDKGKGKQSAPQSSASAIANNAVAPALTPATAAAPTNLTVSAQVGPRVRQLSNGQYQYRLKTGAQDWIPAIYHAKIRRNLLWDADQIAEQYGGYDFEPAEGYELTDRTSFVAAHKTWGPERANRPEINFFFDKPDASALARVQVDSQPMNWYYTGYIVLDHTNEPMRHFHDCPTVLSSCPEGWRLDAIEKRNPKITTQDLWGRLPPQHREKGKNKKMKERMSRTGLTNRSMRFRRKAGILSWSKRAGHEDVKRFLREFLTPQQLQKNTTSGGRNEDLSANELKELDDYLEAVAQAGRNGLPVPAAPSRSFGLNGAIVNVPQGATAGPFATLASQAPPPATFGPTGYVQGSIAGPSAPRVSQNQSSPLMMHNFPELDPDPPGFSQFTSNISAANFAGLAHIPDFHTLPEDSAAQNIAGSDSRPDPVPNINWDSVPDRPLTWDSIPDDNVDGRQSARSLVHGQKRKNDSDLDQSIEGFGHGSFDTSKGDFNQMPASSRSLAVPSSKKRRLGSSRTDPSLPTVLSGDMVQEDHVSNYARHFSPLRTSAEKQQSASELRFSPAREETSTPEVISEVTVEPGQEPMVLPIGKSVSFFLPNGKAVNEAVMTGTDNTVWKQQRVAETIAMLEAQLESGGQPAFDEPLVEPTASQMQSAPTEPWFYEVPSGFEVAMFPVGAKIVLMCGGAVRVGVIAPNQGTSWSSLSEATAIQLLYDVEARQQQAQAPPFFKEESVSAETFDDLFDGSDPFGAHHTTGTSPESNLPDGLPAPGQLMGWRK